MRFPTLDLCPVSESPHLSVVVPFYNEEESVGRVHSAIVEALELLGRPFEMIFVNDGSHDGTLQVASTLARRDDRLTVVSFRRNYGQTQAMAAGIAVARGAVIVTMDGDLQNDPRDIERLLAGIDQGSDIVVGWRHDRHDALLLRLIPSRAANWLIRKVTGVNVMDSACSLKAYRASLIKDLPLYSDMHRFIPAIASIAGSSVGEVKVRHHPRRFGRSKYGLSRLPQVLLDLLIVKTMASFAARPLRTYAIVAAPLSMIGVVMLVYSLWIWGTGTAPSSVAAAGSALICLVSASAFIMYGLLGELVYSLGDLREHEFSLLTMDIAGRGPDEALSHAG